ncbi:hypothetical protein IGX29_00830 [Streptomyces sp. H28]|uniref:DUF6197 family protein n=1 Tax=Streptomyces TaxID=1883 RepID=UPI001786371D|nr:hypothetical protein [Streptomyces sp. H28]MBD9730379.1 hypothetical protein [Streptomyces sp. H28]MBM7087171.1 hypothetical protein [Streptomyces sp. S12]
MPMPTTAPAVSTAAAVVFTDATLRKAQEITAASYLPVWTGPSGEESSGEAVARHLEATITLLNEDGWIRAYDHSRDWSTGADLADDDSMTVKDMLRALLRFVREESGTEPQRTLSTALRHVGEAGEAGDTDTASVAGYVLDRVIQAHTGSDSARAIPWSERQHRTHADITALLTAGARFARAYGPGAAGSEQAA